MENTELKPYPNISQSFGIAGIMILFQLVFVPIISLGNFIGKEFSLYLYYVLSIGSAFLIVYTNRKRKTGKDLINISVPDKYIVLPVIVGTLAIMHGVTIPISSLIPMPDILQQAFLDTFGGNGVFTFLTIVIAAPVLEELIFRGIMLEGLLAKYSPVKSIVVTSILFGIAHLNPWQFVSAFALGLFTGWVFYKTRNLSFCIIIHATNNLIAFIAGLFADESAFDQTMTEYYGGAVNYALVIIISIAILCGCILFLKSRFLRNEPTVSDTTTQETVF